MQAHRFIFWCDHILDTHCVFGVTVPTLIIPTVAIPMLAVPTEHSGAIGLHRRLCY